MRHFKETRNEEEKMIQFVMFDERIKDPARLDVELSKFDGVDEEHRNRLREAARCNLERQLDKRIAHPNLEDKIMTEEEWRAMIDHESEAEIPPVPTYKQVVQYVYETALKEK